MNQNRKRRGFSLIELMIVIAIILIIATIALPKLNRAKMYAHETAAIKTLQTIHTAQTQFQSQFGRFAVSLTELGPPQSGQPGPQAADLIDNNLASGEKSGETPRRLSPRTKVSRYSWRPTPRVKALISNARI